MPLPSSVCRCGIVLTAVAFLAAGCDMGGSAAEIRRLREENEAQKKEIGRLNDQALAMKKTADEQAERIVALQKFGPDRLEQFVYAEKIELDRLTGGYDEDGKPGDDGVVAYVRPVDRDGHVVKVPGVLKMDVWDLNDPNQPVLVAHAELDVEHTRKAWHGRLWTNHFTIKCPWRPPDHKPPARRHLTVRVTFADLMTGKVLFAEKAVEIKLPPDATTRPAK